MASLRNRCELVWYSYARSLRCVGGGLVCCVIGPGDLSDAITEGNPAGISMGQVLISGITRSEGAGGDVGSHK